MKLMLVFLFCCWPLFAIDDVAVVAVHAVDVLRAQMRDPDSLVIEAVYIKPDKKPDKPASMLLCYRARNGFGGYTAEMARIKNDTVYTTVPDGCGLLNPKRLIKIGWIDITDDYVKATAAKP